MEMEITQERLCGFSFQKKFIISKNENIMELLLLSLTWMPLSFIAG